MTRTIDDYLREVEDHLEGTAADKRQILRELRSHLEERLADLTTEDPHSDPEEIATYVVEEFGNPRELAMAYDAEGRPELHDKTGRTLLTMTEAMERGARVMGKGAVAVGRGTAPVLKGVAIALAVLLVLATGMAIFAWYEVRPVIERNIPYDVYSGFEQCTETSCPAGVVEEGFYIHAGAREIDMDLSIRHEHDVSSTLRITITDPDGHVRFDRAFVSEDNERASRHFSWGPVVGDWTIAYDYSQFRGSVWVDIDTIGAPTGSISG